MHSCMHNSISCCNQFSFLNTWYLINNISVYSLQQQCTDGQKSLAMASMASPTIISDIFKVTSGSCVITNLTKNLALCRGSTWKIKCLNLLITKRVHFHGTNQMIIVISPNLVLTNDYNRKEKSRYNVLRKLLHFLLLVSLLNNINRSVFL